MTRRRVVWLLIAVPLAACGGLTQPGGLLRLWIIDVGRRRVAVPIGTVGG